MITQVTLNKCVTAANKAKSVLRMVKRVFTKIDKQDFNILYKMHVYGLVWSSASRLGVMVKDIQILEKVQQIRATKWVTALQNKSYDERLKILKLTTLEKRRK